MILQNIDFHRTREHYIPEDTIHHSHSYKTLNSINFSMSAMTRGKESPTILMFPQRQRGETCRALLLRIALVIVFSHLSCPLTDPAGTVTIQTAHLQQVTGTLKLSSQHTSTFHIALCELSIRNSLIIYYIRIHDAPGSHLLIETFIIFFTRTRQTKMLS